MSNLIIIDITDEEKPVLDGSHNLMEIPGTGKVVVKNPSDKSRLWNSILDLKEIVNTDAEKVMEMGIINPGKQFENTYSIENLERPCLKLKETFDTNREMPDKVNNTFLYDRTNPSRLTIELTNRVDKPISDIKVVRNIPDFVEKVEPPTAEVGEVEVNPDKVIWTVNSIQPQSTATLNLDLKAVIKSIDEKKLGETIVTYLVNGHQLTMMEPEIRGLTDSLSGVTTDESATPGKWDCNVEFINDSEFQVKLEDVKVAHKVPTGEETIVSESPNETLSADESWDKDFQVESENVPELKSSIEFTTLFKVITRVIGEINKEHTIYPVINAKVEKSINPPEVNAYANTDMEIENTVTNVGTAAIDTLKITDELPEDFVPPEIKDLKLRLLGENETIEIHNQKQYVKKLDVTPPDLSPETSHTLEIELMKLGNEFKADTEFKLIYPLLAKNPKPEIKYMTPIEIAANTSVPGQDFITDEKSDPQIEIKYVKRKLKTLKSIRPGASEGEFDISIRIQNKGDVELENVLMEDQIPAGFDVSNLFPEELDYEASQNKLSVHIDELAGNDSLSIKFTCVGSGEYPRTEPRIIVKGRSATPKKKETPSPGPDSSTSEKISPKLEGDLYDLFDNLLNKIEQVISAADLGSAIEDIRDNLPPGPKLHEFMEYGRELKELGEEKVIGDLKDKVRNKLETFQAEFS
ncbi:MAG: hypothetical protein EU541_01990 [Promethearchaeota archaeon]|nr:MAG: hypothetical protein EU541_01990 [Candidatus Lokiarchaeota archaeon]